MIPVFLQVLPLLSGVMYAVQRDPGEVAVDPRLQPDDRGDQRASLVRCSTPPRPNWWQVAVGVGVAFATFFVGLAVFRSSEPKFADTI